LSTTNLIATINKGKKFVGILTHMNIQSQEE